MVCVYICYNDSGRKTMINEKKSVILYVLDILRKYTDKDHSLTYSAINEKLGAFGIEINRKTVANNIDILIDKGFDIRKQGNKGVCLVSRMLEEGELLFLIDAIYSSRSMPTKYANDIVDKITVDSSIFTKKKFNYLEKIDDGNRVNNKQLFLTIEILNEAIEKGKKVEFQYNAYGLDKKLKPKKEGKKYIINPYYMVNNHGKYYLVCNSDKYDNLANYKIECISNIRILDEEVKPIKSLPGQQNFSIKEYMNEHIYMVAGHSVLATVKIDKEERINDIISWFGDKISISKKDNKIFTTMKVNEDSLIYWAMQYGEFVEVISPVETRNKITNLLEDMLKRYKR